MAWTYTDPSTSDRDKVRFLVGDTDTLDQLMSDAEVAYLLTRRADVTLAAADGADALAAKFSRRADTTNLALSVAASQRAKAYAALALSLRTQAGGLSGATMFVGGRSQSAKDTAEADTSAVRPFAKRGQDDYPGT